jgi:hypothetical protein
MREADLSEGVCMRTSAPPPSRARLRFPRRTQFCNNDSRSLRMLQRTANCRAMLYLPKGRTPRVRSCSATARSKWNGSRLLH